MFRRGQLYIFNFKLTTICLSLSRKNPAPLAFVFQQWYTNAWTSHELIPNITQTIAGSAAGTPLADLVHSLAMSRVLKTVRQSLCDGGLSSSLHFPDRSFPVSDVSYVDDMALLVVASASDLVSKVSDSCGIVYVVFKLHGMDLKFTPGKSVVILCFRGPGSLQTQIKLKDANDAIKIGTLPESFSDIFINVAQSYKHLGTLISFFGPVAEVAYRCGMMRRLLNSVLFKKF